jgi:hypothetical protein
MTQLREKDLDKLFKIRKLMEPIWQIRGETVSKFKLHTYKVSLKAKCCVFTDKEGVNKGLMWEEIEDLGGYHELNVVFTYEGKSLIAVPETTFDCSGCFFNDVLNGCTTKKVCFGEKREDLIDVMFVEVHSDTV